MEEKSSGAFGVEEQIETVVFLEESVTSGTLCKLEREKF